MTQNCYIYICMTGFHEEKITCTIVSLKTIPPADMFCTNSFFICSSSLKKYATRGFGLDFITSKLSSIFSTFHSSERAKLVTSD